MPARRILHLVGSPTSDFFSDLSQVYARGCAAAVAAPARYTFINALVSPGGSWRFPRSLERDSIASAQPLDLAAALAILATEHIDIALPQLFCKAGMTNYRALLELLDIPYLGNRPLAMALSADKAKARVVVAGTGVAVPEGQLLHRHERPTLAPPVVVKPNDADNSDGVSLVTTTEAYSAALDEAFAYASTVLVERYIELGREVRCGIIVRDGQLVCLPLEEYFVDPVARPIRTQAHKLKRHGENTLTLVAKDPRESWIVDDDDPIVAPVWAAAMKCHAAIGCEQYSLFDFRIDSTGRPWFLEAGLYCSFSPQSVIATMMAAAGTSLEDFFASAIDQVIGRPRRHAAR